MKCLTTYDFENQGGIVNLPPGAAAGSPLTYNQYPVQTDHTGARAFDTVYHNTLTRPIMVLACIQVILPGGRGSGPSKVIGFVGSTSSPSTNCTGDLGIVSGDDETGSTNNVSLQVTFIVPPGYYYKLGVTNIGGTVNLNNWQEVAL